MKVSIRVKIVALIGLALIVSFLSFSYVGTSLIIQDKSSYIFDYNLNLARQVSDDIGHQILRLQTLSKAMGSVFHASTRDARSIEDFYQRNKDALPAEGLLIVSASNLTDFGLSISLPPNNPLRTSFASQKWRPLDFAKSPILLGAPVEGKFPIGFRSVDAENRPIVLFTVLQIDESALRKYGSKIKIEILDAKGALVQRNSADSGGDATGPDAIFQQGLSAFRRQIVARPFSSGAEEVQLGKSKYLAAYQKVPNVPVFVVGFIAKKEAFASARALVQRSILLGFSIFCLALGITLIFAKGLTSRLRALWLATQQVSEGDFSARVEVGKSNDEIAGLSTSFNRMADRIDELIQETSEKARMKSELETAQAVQNRFFPSSNFTHANIQLSGKAVPATECAGDWWQYRELGPYLLVVLGDVTGHGVSSALVTAAAHGAFAVLVSAIHGESEVPDLGELLKALNRAVRSAGGTEATMTMILSMIDTRTGEMWTLNASHRPPYVHRQGLNEDPAKSFKTLLGAKLPALGQETEIQPEIDKFQLEPGDLVLWYTDGLLECENPEGKPISRVQLLRMLAEIHAKHPDDANAVCDRLIGDYTRFLGEKAENPDDDTTVVVAKIPARAQFLAAKRCA